MIKRSSILPQAEAGWPPFCTTLFAGFSQNATAMGYNAAKVAEVKKYTDFTAWSFGTFIPQSRAYDRAVTKYKADLLTGGQQGVPLVPPVPPDFSGAPPAVSGDVEGYFTGLIEALNANPLCTEQMKAAMGLIPQKKGKPDYPTLKAVLKVSSLPNRTMKGKTKIKSLGLDGIQTYIKYPGSSVFVKYTLFTTSNFTYQLPPGPDPTVFQPHSIYARNVRGGVEVGLQSDTIEVLPKP